ncbi:MAG: amidohydrolase family protein, partial [Desulfovibrionaceae bacterium]
MSTLLIKNGTVITMNATRDLVQADILIDGARIVAMGTGISSLADEIIDASGRVVMPGIIQSHVHLTQTLFRGLADDMALLDWLKKRIWPLEAAHSYETSAISARLGAAELIRGGTTSLIDMGTVHHTTAIFETVRDVGLRGLFGKCMMDSGDEVPAGLRECPETSLKEAERLLNTWHQADHGRIQYAFAPRFAVSCSQKLLEKVRDAARHYQVSVHTHAAENRSEVALVRQAHGMGNIEYFHKLGMTGPRLILAHCIWLSDAERALLASTGTHVVHCPASNMKLASGIAQIPEMLDMGINVALGCDGAPCNN